MKMADINGEALQLISDLPLLVLKIIAMIMVIEINLYFNSCSLDDYILVAYISVILL